MGKLKDFFAVNESIMSFFKLVFIVQIFFFIVLTSVLAFLTSFEIIFLSMPVTLLIISLTCYTINLYFILKHCYNSFSLQEKRLYYMYAGLSIFPITYVFIFGFICLVGGIIALPILFLISHLAPDVV